MTATLPRPAAADAPTEPLPRADGYLRPKSAYLAELVDALRVAGTKRRAAMDRWSARDAQIKAKRGGVSWKVRIDKQSDTTLADIWSEYTFHRDEGMALAAEIQAECAALAAMRGAR